MNVSMKRGREEDATPAMASPRSPQMLDDPREDHGSNAVVGEPTISSLTDNGCEADLLGLFASLAGGEQHEEPAPRPLFLGGGGTEARPLLTLGGGALHNGGGTPQRLKSSLGQAPTSTSPPTAPAARAGGAAPVAAHAPPVEGDDSEIGDLAAVALELDLRTRSWRALAEGKKVEWKTWPQVMTAGVLQSIPDQSKRRRRTGDVKDGEHRAEAMIRQAEWRLTRETSMEDLECLLTAVIRCLWHWSGPISSSAWCVGGSIAATLAARDTDGEASVLRFCLCASGGGCWVGDGQSKIGSSCKFHCDGIAATDVKICGEMHESILLKKCTWMKCCYGKKPFGCPPLVPWCKQCECQKNLDRRTRGSPPTGSKRAKLSPAVVETAARPAAAVAAPKPAARSDFVGVKSAPRTCFDCIGQIAKTRAIADDGSEAVMELCGSCRRIMAKIDEFCVAVPLRPAKVDPAKASQEELAAAAAPVSVTSVSGTTLVMRAPSQRRKVKQAQQAPADLRLRLREVLFRWGGGLNAAAGCPRRGGGLQVRQ